MASRRSTDAWRILTASYTRISDRVIRDKILLCKRDERNDWHLLRIIRTRQRTFRSLEDFLRDGRPATSSMIFPATTAPSVPLAVSSNFYSESFVAQGTP